MLFLLVDCSPEESVALYGKEAKKRYAWQKSLGGNPEDFQWYLIYLAKGVGYCSLYYCLGSCCGRHNVLF